MPDLQVSAYLASCKHHPGQRFRMGGSDNRLHSVGLMSSVDLPTRLLVVTALLRSQFREYQPGVAARWIATSFWKGNVRR